MFFNNFVINFVSFVCIIDILCKFVGIGSKSGMI